MAPWHLNENADKQKSKEALESQSPIAAFKACNMIQAHGIAYSKIVLPSGDSKAESVKRQRQVLFYARSAHSWCVSSLATKVPVTPIVPLQPL